MNDNQRRGLYGPLFTHGDYKRGDVIKFNINGKEEQGPIDWVTSPGPLYDEGPSRPITYIVESVIDESNGMAATVYPYQIIQ